MAHVLDTPAGEPADTGTGQPASGEADGKKFKAGRNLPAAIAVGATLLAVVGAALFLYRPSFAILLGIVLAYGCYEISTAMGKVGVRLTLVPLVAGSLALYAATWFRGADGLVIALFLTAIGVLIWRLADGADGYLRDVSASLFVLLYLPVLAGFALLMAHPDDGAGRIVAFIVTVVCSDTGGYFTGVLFGKHPLAPIVSKAKTWEGAFGSLACCAGAGVLFMTFSFHEAWWKGLLFGAAIAVTAILGDLGESMIKRDIGAKDMGTLLPGHGGIMDRLDSLLPCAPVAYLLLSAFHPAG